MNWLLTFNDGCNGQKVANLLTQEDAETYLASDGEECSQEEAAKVLQDARKNSESVQCDNGEGLLFPVPDATSKPEDHPDEDEHLGD